MTPDALPVTRNGITRWKSPVDTTWSGPTADLPTPPCHCGRPVVIHPDDFTRGLCEGCDAVRCDAFPLACREVPDALLRDLDRFDRTDPLMAALSVLDVKLAVVIADQERLLRLLERVAGVVDVRLVAP